MFIDFLDVASSLSTTLKLNKAKKEIIVELESFEKEILDKEAELESIEKSSSSLAEISVDSQKKHNQLKRLLNISAEISTIAKEIFGEKPTHLSKPDLKKALVRKIKSRDYFIAALGIQDIGQFETELNSDAKLRNRILDKEGYLMVIPEEDKFKTKTKSETKSKFKPKPKPKPKSKPKSKRRFRPDGSDKNPVRQGQKAQRKIELINKLTLGLSNASTAEEKKRVFSET